jgi:hypothetical protein
MTDWMDQSGKVAYRPQQIPAKNPALHDRNGSGSSDRASQEEVGTRNPEGMARSWFQSLGMEPVLATNRQFSGMLICCSGQWRGIFQIPIHDGIGRTICKS